MKNVQNLSAVQVDLVVIYRTRNK